jgi:hypothetical protein
MKLGLSPHQSMPGAVRISAKWIDRKILMRQPSNFKKTDVTRATKAVLAAGVDIDRVEIEPATGKITIMTSNNSGAAKMTDLDTWVAKDARLT